MTRQEISTIIPVYNGETYLGEAIRSVLDQDYGPHEVIVVDDGSTDHTRDIVAGFGTAVRYLHQENAGVAAARNRGCAEAKGDLLAFCDADDLWLPGKLTRQSAALRDDNRVDMVFGQVLQFLSPDLPEEMGSKLRYCPTPMPGVFAGTMLIRCESFKRAEDFPTNWKVGEFVDWYVKAVEKGLRGIVLPEVVTRRRIHARNMGIVSASHRADYVRIAKASLDRRRKEKA